VIAPTSNKEAAPDHSSISRLRYDDGGIRKVATIRIRDRKPEMPDKQQFDLLLFYSGKELKPSNICWRFFRFL